MISFEPLPGYEYEYANFTFSSGSKLSNPLHPPVHAGLRVGGVVRLGGGAALFSVFILSFRDRTNELRSTEDPIPDEVNNQEVLLSRGETKNWAKPNTPRKATGVSGLHDVKSQRDVLGGGMLAEEATALEPLRHKLRQSLIQNTRNYVRNRLIYVRSKRRASQAQNLPRGLLNYA